MKSTSAVIAGRCLPGPRPAAMTPQRIWRRLSLEPVIPKYGGGGAHFAHVCRAGEITVARMSRVAGKYRMFIARGGSVYFPREKMAETCSAWPHGYIRLNIGAEGFD